jgi:hypothetical protein
MINFYYKAHQKRQKLVKGASTTKFLNYLLFNSKLINYFPSKKFKFTK